MRGQRKAAARLVQALARTAPSADPKTLAKKALAHFRPSANPWGDVFYVLNLPDHLLVTSANTVLENSLSGFLRGVRDFARVEVLWGCTDRGLPEAEAARRWRRARARLFHVDLGRGVLAPATAASYRSARKNTDQASRAFALVSRDPKINVLEALRKRLLWVWPRRRFPPLRFRTAR